MLLRPVRKYTSGCIMYEYSFTTLSGFWSNLVSFQNGISSHYIPEILTLYKSACDIASIVKLKASAHDVTQLFPQLLFIINGNV